MYSVKNKLLLKGYPDSRLALFSEASKEWDKLVRTGRPLTERRQYSSDIFVYDHVDVKRQLGRTLCRN